jgi:serine/threonine-protein kinase
MNWLLQPGKSLAHFRVVSPLGAGGMGEVYLAEDARLGRRVALKVLTERASADEDRLRRFEFEARTVATLNHPNILTVYDVGSADGVRFIATEYVNGETLRARISAGQVPAPQAIDIVLQVAGALAAAHEAGIVHRDLKPENVMIRADGYVKVLDFGLAKLFEASSNLATDPGENLHTETTPGTILGTYSYMSPEQGRGQPVDHRSDLFSLGVIFYETLTGTRPFAGSSMIDVLLAIVSTEPPPVSKTAPVPPSIDRFVARSLRKSPADRFQSAAEMMAELRVLSRQAEAAVKLSMGPPISAPAPRLQEPETFRRTAIGKRQDSSVGSVAVLPLTNVNQEEDLEYLSDGLTDSLINNLSLVPQLRVLARSTVFKYKTERIDPIEVGHTLGVQAVLTGRVSRRADRLVVGAELVNVSQGTQIWGAQITRPQSDVFSLQDEISREISEALRQRLAIVEAPNREAATAPKAAAYQMFLKGLYFLNKRTPAAMRKAIEHFDQVVHADPGYAPAHAALADCHSLLATYSASAALIDSATRSARRALEIDETLAEAHASLAFIKFRFDLDWPGAELEFKRALSLNPNLAQARHWYAMFLAARRRFDEALHEIERARQLDPLSLVVQCGIARILHFAGRYAEAEAEFKRLLELDPSFVRARLDLTMTLFATGRYREAREGLEGSDWSALDSFRRMFAGVAAAKAGDVAAAREAFVVLQERYGEGVIGPDQIAPLAAALGENEEAFRLLEEAIRGKSAILAYINVEPLAQTFLQVPGVPELFRKHGLID